MHDIRPDVGKHDGDDRVGCDGIGYYVKEAFEWHVF